MLRPVRPAMRARAALIAKSPLALVRARQMTVSTSQSAALDKLRQSRDAAAAKRKALFESQRSRLRSPASIAALEAKHDSNERLRAKYWQKKEDALLASLQTADSAPAPSWVATGLAAVDAKSETKAAPAPQGEFGIQDVVHFFDANAKVADLAIYDVKTESSMMDFLVVATVLTSRHGYGLSRELLKFARSRKACRSNPKVLTAEGHREDEWHVVDLGTMHVHFMTAAARAELPVEKNFGHALVPRKKYASLRDLPTGPGAASTPVVVTEPADKPSELRRQQRAEYAASPAAQSRAALAAELRAQAAEEQQRRQQEMQEQAEYAEQQRQAEADARREGRRRARESREMRTGGAGSAARVREAEPLQEARDEAEEHSEDVDIADADMIEGEDVDLPEGAVGEAVAGDAADAAPLVKRGRFRGAGMPRKLRSASDKLRGNRAHPNANVGRKAKAAQRKRDREDAERRVMETALERAGVAKD